MTLKTTGLDQFEQALLELAFAPYIADAEMEQMAHDIQRKAIQMAPVDEADLISAIKIRRTGSKTRDSLGRFIGGLSTWTIILDGNKPVRGEKKIGRFDSITTVGEYAYIVHEYMGWGTTNGAPTTANKKGYYMPSESSVRRGNEFNPPVESGGKFMERAFKEVAPHIGFNLEAVLKGHFKKLDI